MKIKDINSVLWFFLLMLGIEHLAGKEPAQNIHFENTTYNFGHIYARDGDLDYSFKFKNTTNVPVIIKDIDATCGCTVPKWTRDTIPPNGTGIVNIYMVMNQLRGYFSKVVDVYTNVSDEPIMLHVTGRVFRNYEYEDDFQNNMGHLLSDKKNIDFGTIEKGQQRQTDVKFINNSLDTIHFFVVKKPKKLEISRTSATLLPGGNRMIVFILDGNLRKRHLRKMKEIELLTVNSKKDSVQFTLPIVIKNNN